MLDYYTTNAQRSGAITAIDIYGNRVVVGRFDFGAQGLDRGLVNAAFSQCDLAVFLHPVVATLDALPESTPNGVIYDLRGEEIGRLPLRGVIGPTIGP